MAAGSFAAAAQSQDQYGVKCVEKLMNQKSFRNFKPRNFKPLVLGGRGCGMTATEDFCMFDLCLSFVWESGAFLGLIELKCSKRRFWRTPLEETQLKQSLSPQATRRLLQVKSNICLRQCMSMVHGCQFRLCAERGTFYNLFFGGS